MTLRQYYRNAVLQITLCDASSESTSEFVFLPIVQLSVSRKADVVCFSVKKIKKKKKKLRGAGPQTAEPGDGAEGSDQDLHAI
jgi:hypothetical protein